MADDRGVPSEQTRGFLFADLRGYTDFVERRGDAAAAKLLERYRVLVRDVVAKQQGAEIRTEGDSFFVLFPSASRAVSAALEIVDAAARATADDPAAPIHVGVGVHAGETAELP
jgi:class 3 adenylate cyclase